MPKPIVAPRSSSTILCASEEFLGQQRNQLLAEYYVWDEGFFDAGLTIWAHSVHDAMCEYTKVTGVEDPCAHLKAVLEKRGALPANRSFENV